MIPSTLTPNGDQNNDHDHHNTYRSVISSVIALPIAGVQTWMIYSATTSEEVTQIIPYYQSFFLGQTSGNALLVLFFLNQWVHVYDHIREEHDHSHGNQTTNAKTTTYQAIEEGKQNTNNEISTDFNSNTLSAPNCLFNWTVLVAGIGFASVADYYQFNSLNSTWKTGLFLSLSLSNNIFVDGRHLYEWLLDNPVEFMLRTVDADNVDTVSRQQLILIFALQLVVHVTSSLLLADRVTLPWLMYTSAAAKAILEALEHTDDYITLNDIKKNYSLLCSTSSTQFLRKSMALSLALIGGIGCAVPHICFIDHTLRQNSETHEPTGLPLVLLIAFTGLCATAEWLNGFVNFLNRLGSHIAGTRKDEPSPKNREKMPILNSSQKLEPYPPSSKHHDSGQHNNEYPMQDANCA